jgi:hypothetical protein
MLLHQKDVLLQQKDSLLQEQRMLLQQKDETIATLDNEVIAQMVARELSMAAVPEIVKELLGANADLPALVVDPT